MIVADCVADCSSQWLAMGKKDVKTFLFLAGFSRGFINFALHSANSLRQCTFCPFFAL